MGTLDKRFGSYYIIDNDGHKLEREQNEIDNNNETNNHRMEINGLYVLVFNGGMVGSIFIKGLRWMTEKNLCSILIILK